MVNDACVAVGGVGGSGTRAIAQILETVGLYIGDDLNETRDNLWFTFLFKRPDIVSIPDIEFEEISDIFANAMLRKKAYSEHQIELIRQIGEVERFNPAPEWLKRKADSLLAIQVREPICNDKRIWGWKEPNTHIVLDRLKTAMPNIKYIHVMRNGLDMAFSANQNQLKNWGRYLLDNNNLEVTPRNSLKYWCRVHDRICKIGASLGQNFFLLNFDKLILEVEAGESALLHDLLKFIAPDLSSDKYKETFKIIVKPQTIGRYKQYDIGLFDKEDIDFVRSLGFFVEYN